MMVIDIVLGGTRGFPSLFTIPFDLFVLEWVLKSSTSENFFVHQCLCNTVAGKLGVESIT